MIATLVAIAVFILTLTSSQGIVTSVISAVVVWIAVEIGMHVIGFVLSLVLGIVVLIGAGIARLFGRGGE